MVYLGALAELPARRRLKAMRPLLRRFTILAGSAVVLAFALTESSLATALDPAAAQAGVNSPATPGNGEIVIPGPRRSFLRMAGISQKASVEETLPLLASEVRLRGYVRGHATEYLILLKRYLLQARKLAALAGPNRVIEVKSCADAQPLLNVLGYKLRQPCGPNTSVQTAEPELAFLTIDSGFPLAQLEEALRANKPFSLPYPSWTAPVLFTDKEWTTPGTADSGLIDSLIDDPILARLYSALARLDIETALYLRQSFGIPKLLRVAGVLDFYGSHIAIRSGHVLVPGGAPAAPVWKAVVGVSPNSPAEFTARLLTKDQGWLAAYFDAVSYASPKQQNYFIEQGRLKRFYEAFRAGAPVGSATRPIFRPAPGLPLLMTRLTLDPDGQAHIPGNLEVWKAAFRQETHANNHAHISTRWNSPDDLVETFFRMAREYSMEGPLECFLVISEIDRGRSVRLAPATVSLLAGKFSRYGDQYSTFAEFHGLSDDSIAAFLTTAEKLDRIPAPTVRANATGIFQALLGLWGIMARQGEIENASLNDSWKQVISPFEPATSGVQVFEAGETSFKALMHAAGAKAATQDEIVGLLAGPVQTNPQARQVRQELAAKIRAVLEAQRLVSVDALFSLGNGMNEMAQGHREAADSLLVLAAELREFEMPRQIFTTSERLEYTQQRSDVNHTTLQARTNFARIIKTGTPKELADARGRLAAFLRDTLVGLNYAYYEPPGAQMLHNNAIFVRSHDYSEDPTRGAQPWKAPQLINLGVTASGGAHLCGSLADLPYVLAVVEQDFIVPEAVQSLIWQDFVPTLLSGSVLPRWWDVTPLEMHAVALYQRAGEELFSAAASDDDLRGKLLSILSARILPQRLGRMEAALQSGQPQNALAEATPGDTFFLAAEFRRAFPNDGAHWGPAGKELDDLVRDHPAETSWDRLSQDFGGPHPALAHSNGRELMTMKLFPVYLHYSSRLLAESWDSNNLYWARLADEMGYEPALLNRLVPELTRRMVEKLFATDLEDWPAVLRAERETGDEFRAGKIAFVPKGNPAIN
jgi:hypothetical protein